MNGRSRESIILGLDPGTAITGWGVIKVGSETKMLAFGCIETDKNKNSVVRLKEIARDLTSLIEKYQPDEVAVEDLFFFKNLKTAIKVAQARGVLLVTSANAGLPVFEYTPLQVKQALTGYGRAEKQQIQWMVKEVLRLKQAPKPDDAADALAVAICHEQSRKIGLLAN